ncbi:MAG: metallophosphoesterase [Candidatus Hydrogenedentes bacterium]|nr:metallophosphoesterase [Candidatus Hydrogenedentota bacterium]
MQNDTTSEEVTPKTSRSGRRILSIGVVLVLVLLLGTFVYIQINRVEMDLSPLAKFAETESYDALISRVHAKAPGPEEFSFVVLGDTRSAYERALEILKRAAAEDPAFILSNGDLGQYGTVEEYLEYHLPLVREIAPLPFIPVPGNHERGPNHDFAAFKALYGDERFSFDYGNCRFIGINNSDRPKMGPLDLRYLKRELAKPGVEHRFVIFHQPPEFVERAVGSQDVRGFAWNAEAFHRLMVEYQVDHVFVGHIHGFATTVRDGVRYTITGGGGVGLTDTLGEEAKVHHFVLVHVGPDGIRNEIVKQVDGEWLQVPVK